MSFSRTAAFVAVSFVYFAVIGCNGQEQISTYKIPKVAATPKEIQDNKTEYRLWGLIIPADEGQSWFFKTQGESAILKSEQSSLDELKATINFPEGLKNKPTWKLPARWTEDRANPNRIATLRFGENELSVTKFGGDVAGNISRWRGMVGAKLLEESELMKSVTEFKLSTGQTAYLVDVVGFKNPTSSMQKMGMGGK